MFLLLGYGEFLQLFGDSLVSFALNLFCLFLFFLLCRSVVFSLILLGIHVYIIYPYFLVGNILPGFRHLLTSKIWFDSPRRISLRRAGRSRGGRKTPPRKFLEFMPQKDAFLRPCSPVFLCHFRRISMRQGGAGQQGWGTEDPPAKNFKVYNPKRCIFKAFCPFFSSLFLSLFYFFP